MKLNRFIKAIIVADADYFLKRSFISEGDHKRVLAWLGGVPDDKIQAEVASWLESDTDYIRQLGSEACRFFWYIWPAAQIVRLGLVAICRKYAKALRGV